VEILRARLRNELPSMVQSAGQKGVEMGQMEMEALLANMEKSLVPSFTAMNKAAIDVYSNYALQLSDMDTVQALKQIQSRLQLGLIQGDTVGKLTTDIRQMIGAKWGKPAKGLTYKAQRIARTEMARGFEGGHRAYGQSTDWIIGERYHTNPMGKYPCDLCEPLEGREYYYDKGEYAPIPRHANCKCFSTYLYRQELFTPAEISQMREEARISKPIKEVDMNIAKYDNYAKTMEKKYGRDLMYRNMTDKEMALLEQLEREKYRAIKKMRSVVKPVEPKISYKYSSDDPQFIRQTMDTLAKEEYDTYGFRIRNNLDDVFTKDYLKKQGIVFKPKIYSVGDTMDKSWVWVDGNLTNETLGGTSSIGIDISEKLKSNLIEAMKVLKNNYYSKSNEIYLIGGDFGEWGADPGEFIIKNAKVLRIFDKNAVAKSLGL